MLNGNCQGYAKGHQFAHFFLKSAISNRLLIADFRNLDV
jgi:hypothetical protein